MSSLSLWERDGVRGASLGAASQMPGEVNCLFTKGLIPFVEKEVGGAGVAAPCRAAGRPRDYLMADHNWLSLPVANEVVRVAMELTGDTDVDGWARRLTDDMMDWKPSREYRHFLGTYSMGVGSPRELYERVGVMAAAVQNFHGMDADVQRSHAVFRFTPLPGHAMPRWYCVAESVKMERYPTNWGLPRAVVSQRECAARGDAACMFELRWKNPPLGRRFWWPTAAGGVVSAALGAVVATGHPLPWSAE